MTKRKKLLLFIASIMIIATLLYATIDHKAKAVIMIDAGHGGSDPGTISVTGAYEKNISLTLAEKLASALEQANYTVIMTRQDDSYIGLDERAAMANNANVDFFISMHCNAIENKPDVNGLQVLYYPDSNNHNAQVATTMLDSMLLSTNATNKGIVPQPEIVVLKKTAMQSLLIENGFVTNEDEAKKLESSSYQQKLVKGIVHGVDTLYKAKQFAHQPKEF